MSDQFGVLFTKLAHFCCRCCSPGIDFGKLFRGLRAGVSGLVAVGVALLCAVPAMADGERVALVLAAESYAPLGKSAVKASATEAIAAALKRQGFTVLLAVNPSNAVARAKLTELATAAHGAHAAIVILAGHGVTSGGRTFFLPANAEITRETDLLTRAVSVASVAQIASNAKIGAVLFAMTIPELPPTLQSIDARPNVAGDIAKNVMVAFSTSEKMPVSRADKAAEEAVRDLAMVAGDKPLRLMALVNAVAAGGSGKVVGRVDDVDLSVAQSQPAPAVQTPSEDAKARREAEERAHKAEERVREAEARARQAEQKDPSPVVAAPDSIEALQTVESLFGRAQRKQIQEKLRKLGHYKGPIDAIFAELTRAAIKDYQTAANAPATGYLTPDQVQTLLKE